MLFVLGIGSCAVPGIAGKVDWDAECLIFCKVLDFIIPFYCGFYIPDSRDKDIPAMVFDIERRKRYFFGIHVSVFLILKYLCYLYNSIFTVSHLFKFLTGIYKKNNQILINFLRSHRQAVLFSFVLLLSDVTVSSGVRNALSVSFLVFGNNAIFILCTSVASQACKLTVISTA